MVGPVDDVTPKVAFTETQLRGFYDHLHVHVTFANARDWFMYVLSFYALLRVSEVHRLTWGDLTCTDTYIGVNVPYSKTSLTPVIIKLSIRHDWACPKRALDSYLQARNKYLSNTNITHGRQHPVFLTHPKVMTSAVTIEQSQLLLKTLITRTFPASTSALSASAYAWHSFRRGGTTAMINAGVPMAVVQAHGRWRSDCYLRYYDAIHVHTLLPTQMLQLNATTTAVAASLHTTATASHKHA